MNGISRRSLLLGGASAAGWLATGAGARAAAGLLSGYARAVAEAAAAEPAIARFYAGRDHAPLWTSAGDADRRRAFFRALDAAPYHGLPAARYDAAGLRAAFGALRSERGRGRLEVAMSRTFLAYARDIATGATTPATLDATIVREIPRRDPLLLLSDFAAADPAAWLRGLPPSAPQYAQLMKALRDLARIEAAGGWGPEVSGKGLEPGARGPALIALRARLIAMGYLARSATAEYDARITRAVRRFQEAHGLLADGVAGSATLAELNRSPAVRMRAVTVAMERLRWMNGPDLGRRHIWVDIPAMKVQIVDDGRVSFETPTIVGAPDTARRTPEFSHLMDHMVINPSWHVPRSITVGEYLPALQRNPNAVGHIDVIDRNGRVVPRGAVDFTAYTARSFPFSMRQAPSERNALGLVKFMFPNRWNIYLHDTPQKALFARDLRTFSHGCIRLERPFDFAHALLARQSEDPEALFDRHLATRRETYVRIEAPVPVHLVYFTAWPSSRGQISYRRDIYGRDERIFAALEEAGVSLLARAD